MDVDEELDNEYKKYPEVISQIASQEKMEPGEKDELSYQLSIILQCHSTVQRKKYFSPVQYDIPKKVVLVSAVGGSGYYHYSQSCPAGTVMDIPVYSDKALINSIAEFYKAHNIENILDNPAMYDELIKKLVDIMQKCRVISESPHSTKYLTSGDTHQGFTLEVPTYDKYLSFQSNPEEEEEEEAVNYGIYFVSSDFGDDDDYCLKNIDISNLNSSEFKTKNLLTNGDFVALLQKRINDFYPVDEEDDINIEINSELNDDLIELIQSKEIYMFKFLTLLRRLGYDNVLIYFFGCESHDAGGYIEEPVPQISNKSKRNQKTFKSTKKIRLKALQSALRNRLLPFTKSTRDPQIALSDKAIKKSNRIYLESIKEQLFKKINKLEDNPFRSEEEEKQLNDTKKYFKYLNELQMSSNDYFIRAEIQKLKSMNATKKRFGNEFNSGGKTRKNKTRKNKTRKNKTRKNKRRNKK